MLLFILLCSVFAAHGNAQVSYAAPEGLNVMKKSPIDYHTIFSSPLEFGTATSQSKLCQSAPMKKYPSLNHLPGMFCKLEYKIETKSKLAPRFRLGSLAYTEWMEGKQDLYLRHY